MITKTHNAILQNNIIYSGQVIEKNNQLFPQGEGKAVLSNGDIYIGEWNDGRLDGIGVLMKVNHSRYHGQFKQNQMHGYGKLTFINKEIVTMEGFWDHNLLNGESIITYKDGSKYVGTIKNFLREGVGTLYFHDGGRIKATWRNNLIHGQSEIIKDDCIVYCQWVDGRPNNQCKILFTNNNNSTCQSNRQSNRRSTYWSTYQSICQSIYQGECDEKFRPHRWGMMKYEDGSVYRGEWSHGLRDGYGFFRMSSGDYYNGYWHDDKKHYIGIYYSKIGSRAIEFTWDHDKIIAISRCYYY